MNHNRVAPMNLDRVVNAIKREGATQATRIAAGAGLQKLLTVQPIDELCYQYSLRQLQSLQSNEEDVDSILDTAYQFSGVGQYRTIAPIQVRAELASVVQFIAAHEPTTVLEIGTDNGGTFYTWCRGLESTDTVLSLDLPGGSTPPQFLDRITPDTETTFIRGNSHTTETRNEVERVLDGSSIDLLFIDGDHTLEGVKRDFELYEPFVSDDGLIAFHDIVTLKRESWNEVDRLWADLKPEYTTTEIIDEVYDPHDPISVAGTTITGHGFGILEKDTA